jgi:ethanolamine permease
VGRSDEPLLLGFRTIFRPLALAKVLALFACTGLAASFHAIIYAYGRQIYSLSRAGYFPTWLSVTGGERQTPGRALIAGSIVGYGVALTIRLAGQKSPTGAVLLNMAVLGAVLSYVLQMVSFLRLRWAFPSIHRPYRSPMGITGAVFAILIAGVTLVALFLNSDYRLGVIGAGIWFLLGIVYFQLHGRKNLILAPEEKFALGAQAQARNL